MGAQLGATCHADAAAAAAAMCAKDYPRTVMFEGSTYVQSCLPLSGSELQIDAVAPGGAVTSTSLPVSFMECDPFAPFADLVELWGLGISAVVVVWCVRAFVLRQVVGNH